MERLPFPWPDHPFPPRWPRTTKAAVVHAAALAHLIVTHVRGWCANSPLQRVRLAGEAQRLKAKIALIEEELRIKDARMAAIPAQRRPHYPPAERLAILELKAANAWNQAQTATRFLVADATIASWSCRLDEQGPMALVRIPTPAAHDDGYDGRGEAAWGRGWAGRPGLEGVGSYGQCP